jgi:hypothetical protein
MKKNNARISKKGIKRNAKNTARIKRNQLKHEKMIDFLQNKVLKKYDNLWSKEYSDEMRNKIEREESTNE